MATVTTDWNPGLYLRHATERDRPFHDLLTPLTGEYRDIVDLGCGPGPLTEQLLRRWPGARVTGIDNSPAMIEAARRLRVPGQLEFELGDVAAYRPTGRVDLLLSNSTLQWIPGHRELLPGWVAALAPGGVLAFQMPGNFDSPSHTILRELRHAPRWRGKLAAIPDRGGVVAPPEEYLDRLARLGCRVDAWETTYLHVLTGPDPVLEWVRGTALRPVLAALDDGEREQFTAEYAALLRDAYPERPHGTVLPVRRVFVVAEKPRA
ncbi:trans-aconitate 2-methyltransferase [Streptomyces capparidis]